MRHMVLMTIAALLLIGCSNSHKSDPKLETSTPKELSCCNSIHEAAAKGNIEAVQAHLAAGTNVNTKDNDGLTPLHLTETKEIAELLINKGAKLNPNDNFFDFTPLDFMEGEVDQETINLLREHGGKTSAELKIKP